MGRSFSWARQKTYVFCFGAQQQRVGSQEGRGGILDFVYMISWRSPNIRILGGGAKHLVHGINPPTQLHRKRAFSNKLGNN